MKIIVYTNSGFQYSP